MTCSMKVSIYSVYNPELMFYSSSDGARMQSVLANKHHWTVIQMFFGKQSLIAFHTKEHNGL